MHSLMSYPQNIKSRLGERGKSRGLGSSLPRGHIGKQTTFLDTINCDVNSYQGRELPYCNSYSSFHFILAISHNGLLLALDRKKVVRCIGWVWFPSIPRIYMIVNYTNFCWYSMAYHFSNVPCVYATFRSRFLYIPDKSPCVEKRNE